MKESFWKWSSSSGVRRAALPAAAGMLLLLWCAIFYINRFELKLIPVGETDVVIGYKDVYQDAGAVPVFSGTVLFRHGFCPDIPVEIRGEVNSGELGKYEIEYSAHYLMWQGSAVRRVRVADQRSPVIELTPDPAGTVITDGEYKEAGYRAFDDYDGDITDQVVRTEAHGTVTYAVADSSGNPAVATRKMPPAETAPPQIRLKGYHEIHAFVGEYREDPGFSAEDCFGMDITDDVEVEGEVIWYEPGDYTLTYSVTDRLGNTDTVERIVHIMGKNREATVRPAGKIIYLTFDDGPGPETDRILDILAANGVKATFFVTDSGYDEQLDRIVKEGHGLGIHTVSHDYHKIYASPEAYFDDLHTMQEHIFFVTGIRTWMMRFPGGSSNTVSGFNEGIMTTLTRAVENAGYRYYDWNVDSNDATDAGNRETVLQNVIDGVQKQRISIVLQHDTIGYSIDAVEEIIRWGKENGYTFLPLQPDSPTTHHGVNN